MLTDSVLVFIFRSCSASALGLLYYDAGCGSASGPGPEKTKWLGDDSLPLTSPRTHLLGLLLSRGRCSWPFCCPWLSQPSYSVARPADVFLNTVELSLPLALVWQCHTEWVFMCMVPVSPAMVPHEVLEQRLYACQWFGGGWVWGRARGQAQAKWTTDVFS